MARKNRDFLCRRDSHVSAKFTGHFVRYPQPLIPGVSFAETFDQWSDLRLSGALAKVIAIFFLEAQNRVPGVGSCNLTFVDKQKDRNTAGDATACTSFAFIAGSAVDSDCGNCASEAKPRITTDRRG